MANKPKNRSAHDKKRDRQRALREARKQATLTPLQRLKPPGKLYQEWITVGDQAKDLIVHPARYDDRLSDTAKDLADTFVRLGPRYGGVIPMAAVFLDEQIQKGVIHLAVPGDPDSYQEVSLAEMAAGMANPEINAEMRRMRPDAVDDTPVSDEGAAMSLHELHAHGYLIVDDDYVVHAAMPPKTPGGKWWLSGSGEEMPI